MPHQIFVQLDVPVFRIIIAEDVVRLGAAAPARFGNYHRSPEKLQMRGADIAVFPEELEQEISD